MSQNELSRRCEHSNPALELLRDVFRHDHFLPFQEQIIGAVLEGKDLLAVLPTGSGKSLCFQIPALLRKGITIVISPLIALMKDQIDRLRLHALPVAYVNSSLSAAEIQGVLASVRAGSVRLVYISPERLRDPLLLHTIRSLERQSALWVVDEAHCITEWGHDFRTDYLFIPDAIEAVSGKAQLILFTATATPLVREDILRQMRRPGALTICGSFDRPNLYLGCRAARTRAQKLQTLLHLLRRPGPGIIYTATRKQCETVNRFLQESGFRSDFYHAGRSASFREEVHERFMGNLLDIVVATNAFGMGLNKPDIRFIIHYAHPSSVDAYYQEIGRGGRDGERCDCILLYSAMDRRIQERFILNATPPAQAIANFFAEIARTDEKRELSVSRSLYEAKAIELFELEKAGILERRSIPCGSASLYLSRPFEKTYPLLLPEEQHIFAALEARYSISRAGMAGQVDLYEFCSAATPNLTPFLLEQRLLDMAQRGAIVYRPQGHDIRYHMRERSFSEESIGEVGRSVTARRKFKLQRLDAMAAYGTHNTCLRTYLLEALSDRDGTREHCGFCDNCQ